MTITQRLRRYLSAWAQLDQLRRLKLDTHSLDAVVDGIFNYCDGFFAPIQIREEIVPLLHEVRAMEPRAVVEVGTSGGGTLLLWSRIAHPEATIVTIDLPGGDFGGGSSYLRVPLLRRCGLPGQKVHLIRADSHRPATLELTKAYLEGQPVDFLFIDADHTEAGVRADFANYSPLVRPGGLIAFHDIAIDSAVYGVKKVWTALRDRYPTREFRGSPLAYGLGVLTWHQ